MADGDWGTQVEDAARQYGVDPSLARSVMQTESSGRADAMGPPIKKLQGTRAIGLMQLLPSTAQKYGVDPYDPQQNIQGGVRYLADLSKKHGGDRNKILAEYQSGIPDPTTPFNQPYVNKVVSTMDDVTDEMNGKYGMKRPQAAAPTKPTTPGAPPTVPQPPPAQKPPAANPDIVDPFGLGKVKDWIIQKALPSLGRYGVDTALGLGTATMQVPRAGYAGFEAATGDIGPARNMLRDIEALPGGFAQYAKQYYGSPEAFRKALADDPARVMGDLSAVLSAAGLGARGAGAVARIGGASSLASDLSSIADFAKTGATYTDPLSFTRAFKVGSNPERAEKLMQEALKPGAELTAKDPAIVQRATQWNAELARQNIRLVSQQGLDATNARIKYLQAISNQRAEDLAALGSEADFGQISGSPRVQEVRRRFTNVSFKDRETFEAALKDFWDTNGSRLVPQQTTTINAAGVPVTSTTMVRQQHAIPVNILNEMVKDQNALGRGKRAGSFDYSALDKEAKDAMAGAIVDFITNEDRRAVGNGQFVDEAYYPPRAQQAPLVDLRKAINNSLTNYKNNPTWRASAGTLGMAASSLMLGEPSVGAAIGLVGLTRVALQNPEVLSALSAYFTKSHRLLPSTRGITAVGRAANAAAGQPQGRSGASTAILPPTPPGPGEAPGPSTGASDVTDQMR